MAFAGKVIGHEFDEDELEDFWSLVHNGQEDGELLVLGLTSFLDDSISHEQDKLAITTMGGPAMSRIEFKALAREWRPILHKYRIANPLHMADFVRPNGKYVGMHPEMKLALFSDVVASINRHKLYSFSISIPTVEFAELMPEEAAKEVISPYALAFCCAVLMNQSAASFRCTSGRGQASHGGRVAEQHAATLAAPRWSSS